MKDYDIYTAEQLGSMAADLFCKKTQTNRDEIARGYTVYKTTERLLGRPLGSLASYIAGLALYSDKLAGRYKSKIYAMNAASLRAEARDRFDKTHSHFAVGHFARTE